MTLRRLLVVPAALAVCLAVAAPAQAVTFTVTEATDTAIPDPCGVSCTLRAAITDANAMPGPDDIDFSIAGSGPHVISPEIDLPDVTEAVDIDGTTEPDWTSTAFSVELDGTLGAVADGLRITAGGSTVRGLAIDNFTDNGIEVTTGATTIAGNFIGAGLNGAATGEGNGMSGVDVSGTGSTVGGTGAGDPNVISGNDGRGLRVFGSSNTVHGNYIGVDLTGLAALANGGDGLQVLSGDTNTIGGAAAGQRNVISGNTSFGLFIDGTTGGNGNLVKGNYFGVGSDGATAIANGTGVSLQNSADNTELGGLLLGEGNVISGNSASGMSINDSDGTSVEGNLIGRDAANTVAVGNGNEGIDLGAGDNNEITQNAIAHNGANGVKVVAGTGNALSANATFSNVGLGISLENDQTVLPNDTGDADTGPNNRQNFPVIAKAAKNPVTGETVIWGSINSTDSSNFRIEAFSNSSCDASGNGEGADFVGFDGVGTVSGNATFRITAPTGVNAGDIVTTTATNTTTEDTSEFSACATAVDGFVVTDNTDGIPDPCTSNCTLREAILEANGSAGADSIFFDIFPYGPQTIQPTSPLDPITEAVTIDGTTQPEVTGTTRGIEVDGSDPGVPDDSNGLSLTLGSDGSTIRGLAVNRFANTSLTGDSVAIAVESDNNTIVGNYLGTNPAGTAALGNDMGLNVTGSGNTIGTASAGDANVLSGNESFGVLVNGGDTNVVKGNLIGVGADGDADLGNSNTGLSVQGAAPTGNVVGGIAAGERNVISGNSTGVYIDGAASGTDLRGNLIGTNASETTARPNTFQGILIENGTLTTVRDNLIANTGGTAIRVTAGSGNVVSLNRIRDNAGLGIDLVKSGDGNNVVTPNDTGDGDSGPNALQNFPVITSAVVNGATTTITGTLNSTTSGTFSVQGFMSSSCDASGNGEGAAFVGVDNTVNTDGAGNATFQITASGISNGDRITVTANRPSGGSGTSEFSACKTAGPPSTPPPPPPPPPSSADLALTLTADDDTPEPGQPFNYTATLTNRGPGAAQSPQVNVTLAPSVRFLSALIAQSSGCSGSGRVVTCSYSTLANGGVARRRIRVLPTLAGPLMATATASSSTPDPTPASGSKSVSAVLPKPAVAKQVNVKEVSGTVKIKQPGQGSFRTLDGQDRIRMGSLIDTTNGRVRLTSAAGGGKTQTADFYEGLFKVTQTKGKKPITDVRLAGKLAGCKKGGKAITSAKRRKGRRLWGSGKGRFRTRGKRSSALVRGTIWLVEDRCNDTTLTRVRKGVVQVRDFGKRRNFTVRAGRSYVARKR